MDEHAGDRVEPDAPPVPGLQQGRRRAGVAGVDVVDQDRGRPIASSSSAQPPGRRRSGARGRCTLVQLRAHHFEPGVGVRLLPRGPVVFVERGVAVVEADQAVGHPGPAGELDGVVREPERLLAQPDGPALAGPGVEPARGDRREDQADRPEGDQPGPGPGRRSRPGRGGACGPGSPRPTRRSSRPSPCRPPPRTGGCSGSPPGSGR